MPALIVSQVISSGFGFRKRWMLPVASVSTRPRGRILDRRQDDRRLFALAVQRSPPRGPLRQHVAVEHDDRLAERFTRMPNRPQCRAGPARRRADAQARLAAVANSSSIRRGW